MDMDNLQKMKNELLDLEKKRNDFRNKFYDIGDELTTKTRIYNQRWVKENKKTFPLQIGSFIYRNNNLDKLYKITEIAFKNDGIYINTLIINSDSFSNIEIKKNTQVVIYFSNINDKWEDFLNYTDIKIFTEKNYKTRLLDLLFIDMTKEGLNE